MASTTAQLCISRSWHNRSDRKQIGGRQYILRMRRRLRWCAILICQRLDEENQILDAPHRLDALSACPPDSRIAPPPPRAKQFRQLHLELAVLILQPPQPVHFSRPEPVGLTRPFTERCDRDANHVAHLPH